MKRITASTRRKNDLACTARDAIVRGLALAESKGYTKPYDLALCAYAELTAVANVTRKAGVDYDAWREDR